MAKTSVHPIYVISGKEQSLAKRHYQDLLDRLIAPEQRATGLWVTDSKAAIDEVLDELRTLPFLTDRRVVVVQEADEFITKHRPLLETYFDAPCASGVLVLIAKSFPSSTKLAKKLKKVGELVAITPPKPWQLPAHITQHVKQTFNIALARDAAQLLVDLTGNDVTRLYSEVEKLVVFVDDKRDITVQDVEALVGHNRIFGVFEVIDAMVAGQTGAALSRLRNMFAEDKNAQYTVVGAFAFHFRKMFNAKALLSQGRSIPEVTKALRIWGKTDQFYAQVRRVSLEQISQIIQQLASIDHQMKTGQTRGPAAIEQLVLKA
ncbi:MAG: DNA polymerase III subunit delta [Planctomycetes bacterium]|nr:DNA polymerase III subunit delta [Planctomycetota bacterium]